MAGLVPLIIICGCMNSIASNIVLCLISATSLIVIRFRLRVISRCGGNPPTAAAFRHSTVREVVKSKPRWFSVGNTVSDTALPTSRRTPPTHSVVGSRFQGRRSTQKYRHPQRCTHCRTFLPTVQGHTPSASPQKRGNTLSIART